MSIKDHQRIWNNLGKRDPLWAVLTYPEKKGNRWHADEFFETGVEEIRTVLNHIASIGFHLRSGRALDFGCGVGRLTQALASHFDQVVGIDVAPSMIEQALSHNRFGERCQYLLLESGDLSTFENDAFDFVYSNITLQHIPPPHNREYVKELVRVTAPTGLLVFQVPSQPRSTAKGNWKRRLRDLVPSDALRLYHRLRQKLKNEMGMYGIARNDVISILAECDARCLDVRPDRSGGPGWESFRYFVVRGRTGREDQGFS